MNNKILGIIIGIIAVIAIGIALANQKGAVSDTEMASSTTQQRFETYTDPAASSTATMTSHEVSAHNSQNDCYSIIKGKVYNFTSFISQHPGGASAILSMCGKDATASYEYQHGSKKKHEENLAQFFIADLAE